MRFGTLTLFALISSLSILAQPDLSLVRFKDGELAFEVDSTNYTKKVYVVKNGPLFLFQIINKSSHQIELEFIRESDSTYYFNSYFPSGKQKLSGFLNINLHWFRGYMVWVPDFKKDPDGSKGIMKDSLVSSFHSGQIEYVWEYDSAGSVSAGYYNRADKDKTGKWYSGFLLKSHLNEGSYFVRTKAQRYHDGFPYPDSIGIKLNSIKWPDIKGTWLSNQEYSNDSVILYHPANNWNSEPAIEFISDKQYYLRNSNSTGVPKWINEWSAIGDRLFLKIGRSTHEYKIISFTGSELVIQLVAARDLHY